MLYGSAAILLLLGVAIGRPVYRIRAFDAEFGRITKGASEASVLELMGKPDRIEPRPSDAFWGGVHLGDDVARDVLRQYWYTVNLPPVPVSWTVGFDANGRVISKHRWD